MPFLDFCLTISVFISSLNLYPGAAIVSLATRYLFHETINFDIYCQIMEFFSFV